MVGIMDKRALGKQLLRDIPAGEFFFWCEELYLRATHGAVCVCTGFLLGESSFVGPHANLCAKVTITLE